MKIQLDNIMKKFSQEISKAKANDFEAVIIPQDVEEIFPFNNIEDKIFINEMANDCGWDKFIIIDLIENTSEIIDNTLEAA